MMQILPLPGCPDICMPDGLLQDFVLRKAYLNLSSWHTEVDVLRNSVLLLCTLLAKPTVCRVLPQLSTWPNIVQSYYAYHDQGSAGKSLSAAWHSAIMVRHSCSLLP